MPSANKKYKILVTNLNLYLEQCDCHVSVDSGNKSFSGIIDVPVRCGEGSWVNRGPFHKRR